MTSTSFKTTSLFPSAHLTNPNPKNNYTIKCNPKYGTVLNLNYSSKLKLRLRLKSKLNSNNDNSNNKRHNLLSVSRFAATEAPAGTTNVNPGADDRLKRLVSEFQSLTEPIDRVKRLLDCAARLPPFDESARSTENRVLGCTTQVWLEAKMDDDGRMRFKAYSDSEIAKGFISCLIWLLDGADPDEVLALKREDLEAMNVGLYGKAQSRVNTWHNVLISMQNRTRDLVAQREETFPMEQLPSLLDIRPKTQDHRYIVHGLSGDEVLGNIKDISSDAFLVAKFEVSGELLSSAIEAKRRGM